MARATLGDVAIEHKETRKDARDLPVVGLEHITSGELTLSSWDDGGDNTFTKIFRKGHVLFGRRRAYLKKAAVAPFDGICSGDITVIEAKSSEIMPELLPFVIQNDRLFDYAMKKSAGSMSPRVKWEHLKDYEFELPRPDAQKKLAEVLWVLDEAKRAYKALLAKSDELVKSQFVEMFGDPATNNNKWDVVPIGALFQVGSSKRIYQCEQTNSGVPFLRIADLMARIQNIETKSNLFISETTYNVLNNKGFVPSVGDILVTARGTLGMCYQIKASDKFYFQDGMISWLSKMSNRLESEYILQLFRMPGFRLQIDELQSGSTVNYLSIDMLKRIRAMVPPLPLQKKFADFVSHVDKSKFELQQTIDKLEELMRSILKENLG